jgi:ankyrin repeat protein
LERYDDADWPSGQATLSRTRLYYFSPVAATNWLLCSASFLVYVKRIPLSLRSIFCLSFLHLLAGSAVAQPAADADLSVNARFLVAARNADATGMERALAAGANVNSRNRLGESALVILLKNNKVDLAQEVLAAGADVNLAAVNGITPLMTAAFNGQTAIAKQLLDKGANLAPVDRLYRNAMTYAAGSGSTEIVVMFLAKGVDANAVYNNDLTALMWAAGFGKTPTVTALLAAGAKPGLKDNRGKTATDMAREEHFTETAAVLDAAK